LINDVFAVIGDLILTGQHSDTLNAAIWQAEKDVRQLDWAGDVLPLLQRVLAHVKRSMDALKMLEEDIEREATVTHELWLKELWTVRRSFLKDAASRHVRLLNLTKEVNRRFLEA
jgi:hypothetical protein